MTYSGTVHNPVCGDAGNENGASLFFEETIMTRVKYLPYAMIAILFWSCAFLCTQYAAESLNWQAASFFRYFFASVGVLVIMLFKHPVLPKKKDIPKFLLAGFFGFALFGVVYNLAAKTMTNAACGVSGQLNPIFTAVLCRVFLKEKFKKKGWIAIGICFSGALVIFLWHGLFSVSIGFLLLIGSSLCMSIYNTTQRLFVRDYPAFECTAYSILGGTLFLSVFAPTAMRQLPSAPAKAVISLLILGFFCSALAYILWARALSLAEHANDVANLLFIQPLFQGIVGFIGRGEIPGIELYIGGVLVIFGLILFRKWS